MLVKGGWMTGGSGGAGGWDSCTSCVGGTPCTTKVSVVDCSVLAAISMSFDTWVKTSPLT